MTSLLTYCLQGDWKTDPNLLLQKRTHWAQLSTTTPQLTRTSEVIGEIVTPKTPQKPSSIAHGYSLPV